MHTESPMRRMPGLDQKVDNQTALMILTYPEDLVHVTYIFDVVPAWCTIVMTFPQAHRFAMLVTGFMLYMGLWF